MSKKVLSLFIIVLLLGGAAYYIFIFTNKNQLNSNSLSDAEKQSAAQKILGRKMRDPSDVKKGNIVYEGKYFTLTYPARAEVNTKKALVDESSTLDLFRFKIADPKVSFVAQVLRQSSITNIDEVSAVKFRSQNSKEYKKKVLSQDGLNGLVFEKMGNENEFSAFFIDDDRLYSFSALGSNPDGVGEVFYEIVESIKFSKN